MKIVILIMLGFSFLLADYIKKGDTVRDTESHLIWQDNDAVETKELLYIEAKRYCEELTLAGSKDWRLPTITVLQKIVDFKRYNPSIKRTFHHMDMEKYWSSTIYAGDSDRAWAVDFTSGTSTHNRDSYKYRVRCVRQK